MCLYSVLVYLSNSICVVVELITVDPFCLQLARQSSSQAVVVFIAVLTRAFVETNWIFVFGR